MKALTPADILKKRCHDIRARIMRSMALFALLSAGFSCTRIDRAAVEPVQHYDRSLSRLTELAGPPDPPETEARQALAPASPATAASAAQIPTDGQMLSLYFYADSAHLLRPGEEEKLTALLQRLHQAGSDIRTITLLGYAADTGNPAGEDAISSQRASYLANRLRQAGLPAGIVISARGRGAASLISQLEPDEAAAASRRVDIFTE